MDTQQDDAEAEGRAAPLDEVADHTGDAAPPDPAVGPDAVLLAGWMTRAQVSAELKVSVDTLQRWESRRIGPPTMRLSRHIYYRVEAVREWLKSRERRGIEAQARRGGAR